MLQGSSGAWHLASIEILEKPSGRVYYFPCPQWLDRASSTRVKLFPGQKPPRFTPATVAAPEVEEDWPALEDSIPEPPGEPASAGIGGSYTVRLLLLLTEIYSTLLCTLLLYSTLLYSTLLYSTLLYSTPLYSTLLYSTLLYSTLL